jgi:hypothetical protein
MSETRSVTTTRASFAGLVDALDAIIGEGAVVAGDLVIALDDIDLIRLDLRLLLAGVSGVPATEGQP